MWHDTSSEESESEGNEKMDVEFTENEEQSSEDEEDPLKNLYMKLIEKEFKWWLNFMNFMKKSSIFNIQYWKGYCLLYQAISVLVEQTQTI